MPAAETPSIDQATFTARCASDTNFLTNAVAAVLSNQETKAAFDAEVARQSQTTYPNEGIKIESYYKFSYNLKPATQGLSFSANSGPGQQPSGFLPVLSFNGSEWSGLLVEAAKLVKYLPLGLITTALIQALFGTKAGPALLILLLAL